MEFFIVDGGGMRHLLDRLHAFFADSPFQLPVHFIDEFFSFVVEHARQSERYFLLFLEYYFIIAHVFFRVNFEVGSDFVQVQTVFIRTFHALQKELAELGSAERRT